MGRKRKIRICKRCKSRLDEFDDVELTDGHCHDCYLNILGEEGDEIDKVGKELDETLKGLGVE